MEKVELTLLDRLTIPSLLKKEGAFEEMIIAKDIKSKVEISQEDVKEFSIRTTEGQGIAWDASKNDVTKSCEFTELEVNAIKEGLKKLQDEKKLTEDHIDLYRKFIK